MGYLECESRAESMILERKIKKRGIKRWLQSHQHKLKKNVGAGVAEINHAMQRD
jgi:hypothetical protein